MSNHGGKREGGGRPKGPETKVHQINVSKEMFEKLKAFYGTPLLNEHMREFMYTLAKGL
jgi:hypothetical protein